MSTRGVYNQSINYNVVINIINKYIGQEWKNQMRCNIVYTKMEEERTWNLRKAKKWKSRAKKTSRQETPTGFRKKKRTGRSGARTQDRPVTCQICLRIFGCACLRHWAGCLPYYKEKNQSTWNANWFLKKRSEVDALGLEPRTVRLWAGCSDQLS